MPQKRHLELRVLLLGKAINPVLKSFLGTRTVEFNRSLALDEVLDGRIAVNLVLVAEILLCSAVNLSNDEGRIRIGLGEFLPSRSKTLAVTTPWSKELDSKRLLSKFSVKVFGSKRKNTNDGLLLSSVFHLRLLLSRLLLSRLLLSRLLFLGISIKILAHVLQVRLNSAGNTDVLRLSTIGDELDGGITTDTKAISEILLNSAIDLSNMELALGLLREFDPGGSKVLAVTTPWGEELDEPETFLGLLVEVCLSKNLNLSECANDAGCKENKNNKGLHPVKQQN